MTINNNTIKLISIWKYRSSRWTDAKNREFLLKMTQKNLRDGKRGKEKREKMDKDSLFLLNENSI